MLAEPEVPPGIGLGDLDRGLRGEVGGLRPDLAERVAGHLVMAGRLLDDEPAAAYDHAAAARRLAPRLGAVREAAGIAAYLSGRYDEALADLRAARRISGSAAQVAVMADCERGLGRPERALRLLREVDPGELDAPTRVEMALVAAGARGDLGQPDAAVLALQLPELAAGAPTSWRARLRYAYADALLAVGRAEEAQHWFSQAVAADPDNDTGAQERWEELLGTRFTDVGDDVGVEADAPGAGDSAT